MDVKNRSVLITIFLSAVIIIAVGLHIGKGYLLKRNSVDVTLADSIEISRPDKMMTNGVLRIKTDILEERSDTIRIYHADQSLYGAIYSENDETEPAFNGSDSLAIRSYFPDYYVMILDGYELSDGKYRVIIGGSEKYIEHKAGITVFEDWASHLKSSFIVTQANNPLRETPAIEGKTVGDYDYEHLSFETIKINGDWAQVVCNMDCEGCPNQQPITGWLKWKEGNRLLIELYYAC
jgi:hypothetical protein